MNNINDRKEAGAFAEEYDKQYLHNRRVEAIGEYIYKHYPSVKQAQDATWTNLFSVQLKALGVIQLEHLVIQSIVAIKDGSSVDNEVIKAIKTVEQITSENVYMLGKLIKIGIRTDWAARCVVVGKTALANQEEAVFPEFPSNLLK